MATAAGGELQRRRQQAARGARPEPSSPSEEKEEQQQQDDDEEENKPPPPSFATATRWFAEAKALLCYTLNFACFLCSASFGSNGRLLALGLGSEHFLDGAPDANLPDCSSTIASVPHGWLAPMAWNGLLFLLFCAQHSLLGRTKIQERSKQLLGAGGERLAHLLTSVAFMILLCKGWTPVPCPLVWDLPSIFAPEQRSVVSAVARAAAERLRRATATPLSLALDSFYLLLGSTLDVLHFCSWCWLLLSLGTIAVYDSFRYRQAFVPRLELPCVTTISPRPPLVYNTTRQPLFTAFLAITWLTPRMSMARLAWSAWWSLYSLVGVLMQERDMLRKQEDEDKGERSLRKYMRRIPRLFPAPLADPATDAECDAVKCGPSAWVRSTFSL